ncbi:hypothetical protein [Burkholderia pseudomallei]|uniref:hypothetical protein n=1 Tax=Burkholderia pseudomallei TaxID=28450 RepID=UPI000531A3D5|nr:hypothetical protein [Burkholderia pseudomallei]KGR92792.1 hypothetical protein X948_1618 [Burkholderia pseudomallei MSHR5608]
MAEKFRRTWQPAPQSRITRILNQVAVLTDFMHGDGSEAFAMLSDKMAEGCERTESHILEMDGMAGE